MSQENQDKSLHDTLLRRRTFLRGAGVVATSALLSACDRNSAQLSKGAPEETEKMPRQTTEKKDRMPVVFLPHGGGPWPFMDDELFGRPGMWDKMREYMEGLSIFSPERPRALLIVSAHWEEAVPTVMTSPNPPMYYDYYNFPKETYEIQWPAPGAPEVAHRVQELLEKVGITTDANDTRGFDHGTFVPLKLAYPDAGIPTFQLSLVKGLDPLTHIKIGRALEPLRDEGVFIIGSGMSYHNLRALLGRGVSAQKTLDDSKAFDEWLAALVDDEVSRRETLLVEWEKAPAARASHPREEHLLPLMVIAGAAGDDPGTTPYRDVVMNAHVSAMHFG